MVSYIWEKTGNKAWGPYTNGGIDPTLPSMTFVDKAAKDEWLRNEKHRVKGATGVDPTLQATDTNVAPTN